MNTDQSQEKPRGVGLTREEGQQKMIESWPYLYLPRPDWYVPQVGDVLWASRKLYKQYFEKRKTVYKCDSLTWSSPELDFHGKRYMRMVLVKVEYKDVEVVEKRLKADTGLKYESTTKTIKMAFCDLLELSDHSGEISQICFFQISATVDFLVPDMFYKRKSTLKKYEFVKAMYADEWHYGTVTNIKDLTLDPFAGIQVTWENKKEAPEYLSPWDMQIADKSLTVAGVCSTKILDADFTKSYGCSLSATRMEMILDKETLEIKKSDCAAYSVPWSTLCARIAAKWYRTTAQMKFDVNHVEEVPDKAEEQLKELIKKCFGTSVLADNIEDPVVNKAEKTHREKNGKEQKNPDS